MPLLIFSYFVHWIPRAIEDIFYIPAVDLFSQYKSLCLSSALIKQKHFLLSTKTKAFSARSLSLAGLLSAFRFRGENQIVLSSAEAHNNGTRVSVCMYRSLVRLTFN